MSYFTNTAYMYLEVLVIKMVVLYIHNSKELLNISENGIKKVIPLNLTLFLHKYKG